TRKTSARIMNSEHRTTELVADRPTPSVPPCVRIPWKQLTSPIINPNTAVLKVGGRKSLKVTFLRPFSRKRRSEMGSTSVSVTQPVRMLQKFAANVSSGTIDTQAKTRVAARNL